MNPPLVVGVPPDDHRDHVAVARPLQPVAVRPAPGPQVDGESRVAAPDRQSGPRWQSGQGPLQKEMGPVLETEALKVDSRRR